MYTFKPSDSQKVKKGSKITKSTENLFTQKEICKIRGIKFYPHKIKII